MIDKKKYNKKYYEEHKEQYKEYTKKYRREHKEYIKKYSKEHKQHFKEYRQKNRIIILNIISDNNPHCVRCGCDDIRLLEINHKNGGGYKETQGNLQWGKFYWDIYKGIRKTGDLELLCKVCNSWHCLELKYGKLPYKISYLKEEK